MEFETVTLEVVDGVAHLTLNRPDAMNSLNAQLAADLRHAAVEIEQEALRRVTMKTQQARRPLLLLDLGERRERHHSRDAVRDHDGPHGETGRKSHAVPVLDPLRESEEQTQSQQ